MTPNVDVRVRNDWVVFRALRYSIRFRKRSAWVGMALTVSLLLLILLVILFGSSQLKPMQAVEALWGQGSDSAIRSIRSRRLPRILIAALVGACLGISGALFQSTSRNPLGSPDIIGFTSGATAGAVLQITVFRGGMVATALAAILGGLVTAMTVYWLSRRDGISGGLRLILVGIGCGAVLSAFTALLMVRADMDLAGTAQLWAAGSLLGRGWNEFLIVAIGAAALIPAIVACSRALAMSEMGDDMAAGVGIRPEALRLTIILIGVGFVGVAVAATGPIAFIALAAPQIARKLARVAGPSLGLSALMGALLLVGADIISQSLSWHVKTPVGYVTSLIGGAYLVILLSRRM